MSDAIEPEDRAPAEAAPADPDHDQESLLPIAADDDHAAPAAAAAAAPAPPSSAAAADSMESDGAPSQSAASSTSTNTTIVTNNKDDDADALLRAQQETLLALLSECTLPPWLTETWNLETPLREWLGVKLKRNHVAKIEVPGAIKTERGWIERRPEDKIRGPLSTEVWAQLRTRLPKLETFDMRYNGLNNRNLDLTRLGKALGELNLWCNDLSGEIDLTKLPHISFQFLYLDGNKLSGRLDLTQLPQMSLIGLYLHNNQFEGSVDLSKLPLGLMGLNLSNNRLVGPVDLSNLTTRGRALRRLDLSGNAGITGTYDLTRCASCAVDMTGTKAVLIGSVSPVNVYSDAKKKNGSQPAVEPQQACKEEQEGEQDAEAEDAVTVCPSCCICCFLPAVVILILFAIAANSDSLSHSVCEQHLNGTCASFFDGCSTSTQVTALPPHDMLCPLSTKCCVAGNDNFFLARAAAGDTNNTFVYSSNDDGGNATTTTATMMHQSSFNYFLSPPVDYIGSEAVKEGGVDVNKALAQLCGKVGFGPVPPGAIWMCIGGLLSVLSSVFLNLLASTECYMRLSSAVGARLARCCRCACPALCFEKCCGDDAEDSEREHGLLDDGARVAVNDDNDDEESLATVEQESLPASPSSGSRFFLKIRERRLQEQQQVVKNVGFVRRCFKPSGLLGWKSLFFLLVAFIDAIYTVAVKLDGEELSGWERFNAFVSILVNGSFLKGGFDVLLVSLISIEYGFFQDLDTVLAEASELEVFGGTDSLGSLLGTAVTVSIFFLVSIPWSVSATLWATEGFFVHLPVTIKRFVRIFLGVAICTCAHLFPGLVLFFIPLVLQFAMVVLLASFVLTFLSWLRIALLLRFSLRELVRKEVAKSKPKTEFEKRLYKEESQRETARVLSELWHEDSLTDNIFHFLRMAIAIVLCNTLWNYLLTMPVNMMTLVYTQGTVGSPNTYVHGEGYARTLFDELATRSQSCYYLQTYVSGIHSFQTFLRLLLLLLLLLLLKALALRLGLEDSKAGFHL